MRTSLIVGMDGQRLSMPEQPYEGATAAPRGSGWDAPSQGPNRALAASGPVLRNRSRAAYRNSCLLRSAINKNTTSEVGKGVAISSTCADDDIREALNALWKECSHQLDPWGVNSFGGILQQAVKARRTAGEVFIKRVPVRLGMGLKVPLQVEVLEAEFCPMSLTKRLPNGNRIVQGVELKGRRRVAYWFYKSHPSDSMGEITDHGQLIRVPARDVIHHFEQTRPGQMRGEPSGSAALLKDKTFAEYSDAELYRKQTRAGFTGFMYREAFGEDDEGVQFDPATGKPLFADSEAAQQTEVVAAGTILRGVPGEKLELFEGDQGGGYAEFAKWQTQQIAAALDLPYSLLSGDWGGLSDRTIRAIMNEYRRGIQADQTNLLGFQLCLKIWQFFVDTAIAVGLIPATGFAEDPWKFYALDLRYAAWLPHHPEQDIRSGQMAISNLFSNPEAEAAERGADIGENMKATARTIRKWRETLSAEGIDPDTIGIYNDKKESTEE